METTPTLPTDSLYKMLTIAGLLMGIGGYALGWNAVDSVTSSTEEVRFKQHQYEQHIDQLGHQMFLLRYKYIECVYSFREKLESYQRDWKDENFSMYSKYPDTEFPNFKWLDAAAEWKHGVQKDIRNIVQGSSGFKVHEPESSEVAEEMKNVFAAVDEFEANCKLHAGKKKDAIDEHAKCMRIKPVQTGALFFSLLMFLCGLCVFLQGAMNWYNNIQLIEDKMARAKLNSSGQGINEGETYPAFWSKILSGTTVAGISLLLIFSSYVLYYVVEQMNWINTQHNFATQQITRSEAVSVFSNPSKPLF